jgi:hypothetical protein
MRFGKVGETSGETCTLPGEFVENPIDSSGVPTDYGIHIKSTVKILAYYMVAAANQRDLFVLKGKQALGTDFYTPFQGGNQQSFPQGSSTTYTEAFSQINIVATEPDTWLKVTLPKTSSTQYYIGASKSMQTYTAPLYYKLQKGQTVKIATKSQDASGPHPFSGARIESVMGNGSSDQDSTKLIAVTMSEDCIKDPSNGSTDLAGDQLVPVTMAGTRYVLIKGESSVGEQPLSPPCIPSAST